MALATHFLFEFPHISLLGFDEFLLSLVVVNNEVLVFLLHHFRIVVLVVIKVLNVPLLLFLGLV